MFLRRQIQLEFKGNIIARHDFINARNNTAIKDKSLFIFNDPKTGRKSGVPMGKDEWVDFKVIAKDSHLTVNYDGYDIIDKNIILPFFKSPTWHLGARTGAWATSHRFKDISIYDIRNEKCTKSNFFISSYDHEEMVLEFLNFDLYELDTDSLKIQINGEDVIFKDTSIKDYNYIVKLRYKDNKLLESKSRNTIIMEWKEIAGLRRIEKEFNIKPYTYINSRFRVDDSLKGEIGFIKNVTHITKENQGYNINNVNGREWGYTTEFERDQLGMIGQRGFEENLDLAEKQISGKLINLKTKTPFYNEEVPLADSFDDHDGWYYKPVKIEGLYSTGVSKGAAEIIEQFELFPDQKEDQKEDEKDDEEESKYSLPHIDSEKEEMEEADRLYYLTDGQITEENIKSFKVDIDKNINNDEFRISEFLTLLNLKKGNHTLEFSSNENALCKATIGSNFNDLDNILIFKWYR